jgi:hypothetical protein
MSQDTNTGAIKRSWEFSKRIQCRVDTIVESGASVEGVYKKSGEKYKEEMRLKVKTIDRLSTRYRLQNFTNRDGHTIYFEVDQIDNPATIFEIEATAPIMDAFGRIVFYESTVRRVGVQDDG